MEQVVIHNASKSYKGLKALREVSFSIHGGEIFVIVGPNGAGKTTLLECMMGLRNLDEGTITVLGMDSKNDHDKLVRKVGAQLQQSELPSNIKVKEAVRLQAGLFGIKVNADELLSEFNLGDKANYFCSKLSGGQKQRLFILLATLHDPEVIFFDELSTGLDPVSRREVWNVVLKLKEQGRTIIVTTHLMQEAEEICDRAMLIDKGRIVDIGTVKELTGKLQFSSVIEFEFHGDPEVIKNILENIDGIVEIQMISPHKYNMTVKDSFSSDIFKRTLAESGAQIQKFINRQSNFEDYFYYTVRRKG